MYQLVLPYTVCFIVIDVLHGSFRFIHLKRNFPSSDLIDRKEICNFNKLGKNRIKFKYVYILTVL